MKKIKTFIYITTMSFFASCSNFLDVTPLDKVLEDDQFATEIKINGALNGLYRQLASSSLYGAQLSQTTLEVMGHVYTYSPSQPTGASLELPIYFLANGNYVDNGSVESSFASVWKTAYNTALNMNYFLKSMEKSNAIISREHKDMIIGEVYGLRAYLHFDIFRLFGPRYEERSDLAKVLPYNRSTDVILNHAGYEEDVYSTAEEYMRYVLEDIRKAEELLLSSDPILKKISVISDQLISDNYSNRNRRMNYYAVKALEARVLQYMGDYKNAAIAAKVVTDQVGDDKAFRWTNPAKVTGDYKNFSFFREVIFGINNPDMKSNYTSFYTKESLRDIYAVDRDNLISNVYAGFGDNLNEIIDIRSKQWISSNSTSVEIYSKNGTYISQKFDMSINDEIPALVNFQPLVRITEMYYIIAEAALKDGDKDTAAKLLNEIARKRNITDTSNYYLKGNENDEIFASHIETEYYREFYGEGQVYFFHKRKKSTKMFKGNSEGMSNVNVTGAYTVPIPRDETNI